jgi:hypothetical protein
VIDNRDQQQTLVVFTAAPGSESDERLRLLTVLGTNEGNFWKGLVETKTES